jgi:ATP-dependent Lhr-like helicase
MDLPGFHPLVSRWFTDGVGEPTSVQRRGWAAIRDGRDTLISAPTGSGKTLAAFLTAIDDLVQDGLRGPLPDEVRVVYVSPLKALSADIHKNLAEPRRGIVHLARETGIDIPRVTAAVRTGDTTAGERAGMLRKPPHILVTTPESLYLLLTSARGREMLGAVRTVIVDEIHAVIGTRRGAHLALSLERLQEVGGARNGSTRPQRIGLSATQKPVREVARFLVGSLHADGAVIVDEGHRRTLDLGIELPRSPLEAVMAHEVWEEYYDRLTELITAHRTTLIFVNTRRLAERLARHLTDRLGADLVTAHHGSLSKERRLDAEHRLKTGALKALVATASLELGIDIGHVDLVCQIGSPHRIATFLQRVGRSGHTITGVPKGRLLPVSRNDLVECAALLRSVGRGDLDAIVSHEAPLDVLAQQITAEVSCREWVEDDLFELVRRAWPFRNLQRASFDSVVAMLSEGFTTRRGRRAALVHRDEVHATLRGRRGSRMRALTCGGAIPELADYRVVLEPEDTFIGTLNEDFAIESAAGDVFQLGNASWRVERVSAGTVRVSDAHGAPPTIPFWLGEAPARSAELSHAVSDLREHVERLLEGAATEHGRAAPAAPPAPSDPIAWLEAETGMCTEGARQLIEYLDEGRRTLGAIPTEDTLVVERFFDASGGMQLVLHAPLGSRITRAWALALRKRFCRQFNFELQAAATDEGLLLSLGPQHSFPLADVFRYLHPATCRDVLLQALLDAPVFQTRWRWNATISLAVPRSRGGSKVPPQLQRMQADDLLAAVFPDAAACLENIRGDREIPDHPLVGQTVRDCLEQAMDYPGLVDVLSRIHSGQITCISRDTPEPSAFAHEILGARPYAFLDGAPLEERRAQAVQTRRASDQTGRELGVLDAQAIARVRDEQRPEARDADELHDVLLTSGFLPQGEAEAALLTELATQGRATRLILSPPSTAESAAASGHVESFVVAVDGIHEAPHAVLVAAEKLPEVLAVHPGATLSPAISPPASRAGRSWTREEALVELLRARLGVTGPTTACALAASLGLGEPETDAALRILESEGVVLRGTFTPGTGTLEWCERRLLARIHRYTINRLRAEISPVSPADFMRFLFVWQHVDSSAVLSGIEGLRVVLAQLDGLELPARAWETRVLPARLDRYDPSMLDTLCLTGEVGWARLSTGPTQVVGATPIALFLREHTSMWLALRAASATDARPENQAKPTTADAARILERLRAEGASFGHELARGCGLSPEAFRAAMAELVAVGLASSDGFAGLRGLLAAERALPRGGRDPAGRWSALPLPEHEAHREAAVETLASTLLQRYGVVFRRLMARETTAVPWRELTRVYRRLEARGEIRGGRFVAGMSGEQFALPEAVERLREVRSKPDDRLIVISAADPLNLTGIVTPGDRVRATAANRLVHRGGVPVMAMEGDVLRALRELDRDSAAQAAAAAAGRRVPVVSGYVGRVSRTRQ